MDLTSLHSLYCCSSGSCGIVGGRNRDEIHSRVIRNIDRLCIIYQHCGPRLGTCPVCKVGLGVCGGSVLLCFSAWFILPPSPSLPPSPLPVSIPSFILSLPQLIFFPFLNLHLFAPQCKHVSRIGNPPRDTRDFWIWEE